MSLQSRLSALITAIGADVKALQSTTGMGHATFCVQGTLTATTYPQFVWVAPRSCTIGKVWIRVGTAPTGAAVTVDVNKNGVTIFTTQANRPSIAASGTKDDSGTPDVTALIAGDELTIDVDNVGSTIAGSNLTVIVGLI